MTCILSLKVQILIIACVVASTLPCVMLENNYCIVLLRGNMMRDLLRVSFPFQEELNSSFDHPSLQHLLHNILLFVRG